MTEPYGRNDTVLVISTIHSLCMYVSLMTIVTIMYVELLPFQALSYQDSLIWTCIVFCNAMYLTVHSPSFFTLILSAGLVISRPGSVD